MNKETSRPIASVASAPATLKELPIPWDAVARDTSELIDTAKRVREYRAFLALSRAAKAAGRVPDIDRGVQAQARVTHMEGVRAGAAAARSMRSLHAGGAFGNFVDSLAASLTVGGTVNGADLWKWVLETEDVRPHLERYGIDAGALDEFGGLLARTSLTASSDGGQIVVEGSMDGKPVSGRMAARPRRGMPHDAVSLLTGDRFDSLCDELERGEPAYLLGAGPLREPLFAEDLMMSAALASQRESIRHLRKLEDVGLTVHGGGEVLTIMLVIAAAIFLTAMVIAAIECDYPDDTDTACQLAGKLAILALFVLLLGLAGTYPGGMTNGNQTISGPLSQLQGQPT
jgi:hypothetical protein